MLNQYSAIIGIPAIFLLIYYLLIRTKKYYIAKFLITIYAASAIGSTLTDPTEWYPYYSVESYSPVIMFVYGILTVICLLPALKASEAPANLGAMLPNWINKIMWVMIIGGAYSLIYQLPYAIQASAVNSDEFRREMDATQVFILPKTYATTVAVFFSTFYLQHISLAFVSTIIGGSRIRTILLWVTSLANVVSGATFSTRDASVFFVFSVIYNYIYFRNSLSVRTRMIVKRTMISLIALMTINLVSISIQRFSDTSGNSLAWGTIGYITTQPFTFAEAVEVHRDFYDGDLRFPVFKAIFNDGILPVVVRKDNYETMFGTFLKDLYCEGGWLFVLIFISSFVLLFWRLISQEKKYVVSSFLSQSLYAQFMFTGVFYLVLGSKQGNIYMIIMLSIIIIKRMSERSGSALPRYS